MHTSAHAHNPQSLRVAHKQSVSQRRRSRLNLQKKTTTYCDSVQGHKRYSEMVYACTCVREKSGWWTLLRDARTSASTAGYQHACMHTFTRTAA
ncbi:MAG: hypothetical protein ACK55Z_15410, partial [bacterium]